MIDRFLCSVERNAAYYQGKGWGGGTVKEEFSQAVSLLDNKDVRLCIDIGGNKGTYTEEIIRKHPLSHVVIFEPAKINVEALNDKFSEKENVVIEPYGVSDSAGAATLYTNEEGWPGIAHKAEA